MRAISKYRRFFTLVAAVIALVLLMGTSAVADVKFPGDGVTGQRLRYKLKRNGQIIRDRNTKLEWSAKVPGGDGQTCLENLHGVNATCTWGQVQEWIDALNEARYAGKRDWRFPNIRELMSIVDYSIFNPAIAPIFDPTAATDYWSSTSLAALPSDAWVVDFNFGVVFIADKNNSLRVRAVRGGR